MDIQIALKKAFKRYSGTGMIGGTTNETIPNIKVNSRYPLVSFIAMIAPSPDWFHGVHDLNLCNTWTGKWRNRVVRKLFPYDAGTDSGVNFTSPNDVTNPPVNIRRIRHDIEGSFQSDRPIPSVGTFTFVKTSEKKRKKIHRVRCLSRVPRLRCLLRKLPRRRLRKTSRTRRHFRQFPY